MYLFHKDTQKNCKFALAINVFFCLFVCLFAVFVVVVSFVLDLVIFFFLCHLCFCLDSNPRTIFSSCLVRLTCQLFLPDIMQWTNGYLFFSIILFADMGFHRSFSLSVFQAVSSAALCKPMQFFLHQVHLHRMTQMSYTYPSLSFITQINMEGYTVTHHQPCFTESWVKNCLCNRNSELNSAVDKADCSNF